MAVDSVLAKKAGIISENTPTVASSGFDELRVKEKLEYVQSPWDRIVVDADSVPAPKWYRTILRECPEDRRLNPVEGLGRNEVRDRRRRELSRRRMSDQFLCASS